LAAERAAVAAGVGAPVSIIRPPMGFGQADRASLQIFRSMQFLPVHPSPGFRRFPLSLVHVADLCDAILKIAASGERASGDDDAHGRYYVAADRHRTYGELGQVAALAA
jgi:nucleoside-diphosphate-sugar epimerase